jgi:hypothetical protein
MQPLTRVVSVNALAVAAAWVAAASGMGVQAKAGPVAAAQTAADPCASPANKIVAENCRPGSPLVEWDIYGSGDPTIQGFATDISVNLGETVQFKIDTHSPRYRIDIYRTGWYGGLGARLIETIRPSVPLPQAQPPCWSYGNRGPQGLIDCGNWAVSASWRVPGDAVSGVYVARLVREDDEPEQWWAEGELQMPREKPAPAPHAYGALGLGELRDPLKEKRASHIVFVVRDDNGRSEILAQTADPTWVAVNRYGGANLDGAWSPTGPAGSIQNRAYAVSYNRPLTTRDEETLGDQFFNSGYPLVRWLERNGYDVSYFTGVDSARRGEEIREHEIFMSMGHDMYWSGEQRANVTAARDAGVHLAFMGGNVGMWKTRYLHSVFGDEGNTPYRTLVCYKETLAHGKLDPDKATWTGTWRDPREFNPEKTQPENALTGTIATVAGFRNDRLMVPASYGALRFWRNTAVAGLAAGAVAKLGRGTLGQQWDQDLDNGVRPAGLVRLSETPVDNVAYLQDWGGVYDSGSATHHMTLYRAASGALVFSAGSPQYAWGLDDLHNYFTDGGPRLRPDPFGAVPAIQQATVNLLADMGAEPRTLQPGLAPAQPSTDRTAPLANITSPLPGAIAARTVSIAGTATDKGGVVAGVEVSVDGGATWHPAVGTANWRYEWQVPAGLTEAVIVSRAVDDSSNLGPASGPVRVRVPRLTTR